MSPSRAVPSISSTASVCAGRTGIALGGRGRGAAKGDAGTPLFRTASDAFHAAAVESSRFMRITSPLATASLCPLGPAGSSTALVRERRKSSRHSMCASLARYLPEAMVTPALVMATLALARDAIRAAPPLLDGRMADGWPMLGQASAHRFLRPLSEKAR